MAENRSCENGFGKFIRNRYFYGKLLTVRDFNLEQSYFINKFRLSHSTIHGYGIVCGLNAEIVSYNDDSLEIKVSKGVALDCCGNEIVVSEDSVRNVENWSVVNKDQQIYVYIKYEECETEPVPNLSNASVCEEECCNSRIEETFSLYVSNDYSEEEISGVNLRGESLEDIYRNIKKSYYTDGKLERACFPCKTEGILIAVLEKGEDGTISINTYDTEALRPVLFTNLILRDVTITHISDFNNPHRVTAEQTGAIVSINNLQNPGGNIDIEGRNIVQIETEQEDGDDPKVIVDVKALQRINGVGNTDEKSVQEIELISTDRSIEINSVPEEDKIDLKISEALKSQIESVKEALERLKEIETVFTYIRERALKCTVSSFGLVAKRFKSKTALEIVRLSKGAVDGKIYEDEAKFKEFLSSLINLEMSLADELKKTAIEESLNSYIQAVNELSGVLDDTLKSATMQDEVCFYASLLEKKIDILIDESVTTGIAKIPENKIPEIKDKLKNTGIISESALINKTPEELKTELGVDIDTARELKKIIEIRL